MNGIKTFFSYAKVNLGLKILNKRFDGYHDIHSLFIEINLSDELTFSPNKNHKLSINGKCPTQFPLDENAVCMTHLFPSDNELALVNILLKLPTLDTSQLEIS